MTGVDAWDQSWCYAILKCCDIQQLNDIVEVMPEHSSVGSDLRNGHWIAAATSQLDAQQLGEVFLQVTRTVQNPVEFSHEVLKMLAPAPAVKA